jgi:hypothetical protein
MQQEREGTQESVMATGAGTMAGGAAASGCSASGDGSHPRWAGSSRTSA